MCSLLMSTGIPTSTGYCSLSSSSELTSSGHSIDENPEYTAFLRKQTDLYNAEKQRQKRNRAFPEDLRQTHPKAFLPENITKHRYHDIVPKEETRVVLKGGRYIPASWVNGHICTQAPKPNTFTEFWLMMHEHSSTIVMLTRLIENKLQKAHMYWPAKENTPIIFGGVVRVTLLEQERQGQIWKRRLLVELVKDGEFIEPRYIDHYQYTEWPDRGVPNSTSGVCKLLSAVRYNDRTEHFTEIKGTVTVHCSAGIGRSGVFIAARTLFKELESGTELIKLDPFGCMMEMRKQRSELVQTVEQFQFIFDVLQASQSVLS